MIKKPIKGAFLCKQRNNKVKNVELEGSALVSCLN